MSNKQSEIDFSKQLVKGKICELIFDRMFLKTGKFSVIPFGYENIVPEIMQYAKLSHNDGILDNVRNAPDFALISHEHNQVFLVEVKYRRIPQQEEIKQIAEKIHDKWKQAILFLATPDGFYFDFCNFIIENKGAMLSLKNDWVSAEIQKEYLGLLNDFIHQTTE